MPDTAPHPAIDAIEAFALGKLPPTDVAPVEDHLAGCDLCQERAQAVAPDTLVELLASARTRSDFGPPAAPTPTFDAAATPSLNATTRAWDGDPAAPADASAPAALVGHPKYRVVRRLGTGGMGTVWLAEHAVMNRPVAVKVIRPDLLARPGATGRFLREVRAAAKLHHPNIVTAFDAEPAGDSCLLVMEYVPGETLAERLAAGPLPPAEACRAAADAARGLAHAHKAGLVHRDVKPHNLIRAADGTVKVLDFGLAGVGAGEVVAAAGDGLTGAGMVVGTPDYIAPEQVANASTADARADVYGLGCTLYHLLAGRPPFPTGSVMEKLDAHQTRDPDPIPDVAAELAAILAKMLARRPEDRYQTADEVVDALDHCARRLDPARQRRRRRLVATAAALLFAGLLAAGGVVFKIYRDNQEITITTDDPDIEVVMKRKGDVVQIRDAKTGQTWTYDVLCNHIAQADAPDGLTLGLEGNGPFVLRRAGKDVFRVTRMLRRTDPPADAGTVGQLRVFHLLKEKGAIWGVDLAPDGRRFLAAGTGGTWLWNTADDRADKRFGWDTWSAYFTVDGRKALVADHDGILFLRDLETDTAVRLDARAGRIRNAVLSPDNRRAAAVSGDGRLRVWNLDTQEVAVTLGEAEFHANRTAAFTPAGREVLYAHADHTLRLYDLIAGAEVRSLQGHTGAVADVAVHPDGGRALTCGRDNTVRLWDLTTGAEVWRQEGHGADHGAAAFVPGGRVVSAGKDGVIRVRDGATGRAVHELTGHEGFVLSVSVSRDGRHALSGGDDGTARLWRLPPPLPAKSDRELILGTWEGVAAEADGKPLPQAMLDAIKPTITFTADKMAARPGAVMPQPFLAAAAERGLLPKEAAALLANGVEGVYHLDPTKSPKEIDVTILGGDVRKAALGVYALDGDTLKLCLSVNPEKVSERPAELSSTGEGMRVLVTLRRLSGAELPGSPKGTFALPKGTAVGDPALTLDGLGKFKIIRNGQLRVEGTYTISGDEITFTDEAGPNREVGEKQSGTYRWTLPGWGLMLKPVKDESLGRMGLFVGGLWVRTPESIAPAPKP